MSVDGAAARPLPGQAAPGAGAAPPDTLRLRWKPLKGGRLRIRGFKHAATLIMAAAVATGRRIRLGNVPTILDVAVIREIVERLGGRTTLEGEWLEIDCADVREHVIPGELGTRIHGAIYLIPALLGRLGAVRYQSFGGCPIGDGGARPIRHMLDVLEKFGAEFVSGPEGTDGASDRFRACEVDIMRFSEDDIDPTGPLVSGATKTAILAALTVDQGETIIRSAYLKPDVTELLDFAAACGYGVSCIDGDVYIRSPGKADPLRADAPVEFCLVSDISEVMTFASISVLSGASIGLECRKPEKVKAGLAAEIEVLERMGIDFLVEGDMVSVRRRDRILATDIVVRSAGIYSDHQPLFALMLCYADGPSTIRETVWKERFAYADELNRLGAEIERRTAEIAIVPRSLHDEPAVVRATDLRAAAVLVVAGLVRGGETVIEGASHLERGYSDFASSLARLDSHVEWSY